MVSHGITNINNDKNLIIILKNEEELLILDGFKNNNL